MTGAGHDWVRELSRSSQLPGSCGLKGPRKPQLPGSCVDLGRRTGATLSEQPVAKGLVLVVEDERPIADLVRLYLTRDGFGVHVEHNGTAGLAAARKVRPVACILDIALPGLDGTEVCR